MHSLARLAALAVALVLASCRAFAGDDRVYG